MGSTGWVPWEGQWDRNMGSMGWHPWDENMGSMAINIVSCIKIRNHIRQMLSKQVNKKVTLLYVRQPKVKAGLGLVCARSRVGFATVLVAGFTEGLQLDVVTCRSRSGTRAFGVALCLLMMISCPAVQGPRENVHEMLPTGRCVLCVLD